MPEGPLGAPRLANIGPISRSTEDEIRQHWDECPSQGKTSEICREIKKAAIAILEGQGFFAEHEDLVDINSGSCFRVAERVYREVDGVEVYEVAYGEHAWVHYKGTHYDAEVPTGVGNPKNLPFFGRVPHEVLLNHAKMEAEMRGIEPPQTVDETIMDISDRY